MSALAVLLAEPLEISNLERQVAKAESTRAPETLLKIDEILPDGILLSDGRELPWSGLNQGFIFRCRSTNLSEPMETAIRSYHWFGQESQLLRINTNAIWTYIQKDRERAFEAPITVLELGTGHSKFRKVYTGATSTSSPRFPNVSISDVILVDINNQRLGEAHDELSGLQNYLIQISEPSDCLSTQTIHKVQTDFHSLESALEAIGKTPTLTTYLGQTFGNFTPAENYNFLRSTEAEYCLVGVYLMPEDQHSIDTILINYSNPETRFQTEFAARGQGVEEEVIAKSKHGAEIILEDWSDQYGVGFEQVAKARWYLEVGEDCVGATRPYTQGERLVENFSIRYTSEQFAELARQHDYKVVNEFKGEGAGKEVALFLLRREG